MGDYVLSRFEQKKSVAAGGTCQGRRRQSIGRVDGSEACGETGGGGEVAGEAGVCKRRGGRGGGWIVYRRGGRQGYASEEVEGCCKRIASRQADAGEKAGG